MADTPGNASAERLSRAQRRVKRLKHRAAQRRYRERFVDLWTRGWHGADRDSPKRNQDALRAQARTQMQVYEVFSLVTMRHRARIQKSEELKAQAREVRRETDAGYRERRGQKKIIARFGQESFDDIYVPLYAIHGNDTHKLRFVEERPGTAHLAKDSCDRKRR
ncbi:hypothetical protein C8F04DRAFT_1186537 [Mycena alexandri]|uniref:Uncharacterized protein n=1 Tax=Mycena alexandri TaxID=1745969 RepID=A0AAD6X3C7_9AGAR|nr:hypothetical protein C8F04DRAFT_1186537 [Mycena alexandri]